MAYRITKIASTALIVWLVITGFLGIMGEVDTACGWLGGPGWCSSRSLIFSPPAQPLILLICFGLLAASERSGQRNAFDRHAENFFQSEIAKRLEIMSTRISRVEMDTGKFLGEAQILLRRLDARIEGAEEVTLRLGREYRQRDLAEAMSLLPTLRAQNDALAKSTPTLEKHLLREFHANLQKVRGSLSKDRGSREIDEGLDFVKRRYKASPAYGAILPGEEGRWQGDEYKGRWNLNDMTIKFYEEKLLGLGISRAD